MGALFSQPGLGVTMGDGHKRKLVLCGPHGSGKLYHTQRLEKAGYIVGMPITSNVQNKNRAVIVTPDEFESQCERMMYMERGIDSKGVWGYGITWDQFNKSDVLVLSPEGVASLRSAGCRDKTLVVYLDIPEQVRYASLLNKGWTLEAIEEGDAYDRTTFRTLTDYDVKVTTHTDDILDVCQGAWCAQTSTPPLPFCDLHH